MARLSEEEINEVRANADIVDVVAHYIPLTKKGRNYICNCPFHNDHSPSLNINVDKQIYKCFACGAGGNVFSFVSHFENISFIEAVYKVAQICHVQMKTPYVKSSENTNPRLQKIYDCLQLAIDYCSYQLYSDEAKFVQDYLVKRGIDSRIVKLFQLGYHPKDNALSSFLHKKQIDEEIMLASGIISYNDYGKKDVFSDRLMIPLHDLKGNPVGFSARRLHEDNSAKYINSNENEIYHKGSMIFNYHRAREYIRKENRLILVEGAMDVIAYAKCDMMNVIAMLGTAITDNQLQLIKALGVLMVIGYDGDEAGKNATYKLGKMASSLGIRFEIIDNRYGLDPDEIIDAYGKDELVALSHKTISWQDFLFQFLVKRYHLENYSEKKEFALEMQAAIETLPQDFEKKKYYIRLKEMTGFDMEVNKQYNETKIRKPKRDVTKSIGLISPKGGKRHAQFAILSQMLLSKAASDYFKMELGFFQDECCNKLALYIIDFYRSHDELEVADLLDTIKESEVVNLLLEVSEWELALDEVDDHVLDEAIFKLKLCMLDDKIKLIEKQILSISDPITKAQLALQKNELIKERAKKIQERRMQE